MNMSDLGTSFFKVCLDFFPTLESFNQRNYIFLTYLDRNQSFLVARGIIYFKGKSGDGDNSVSIKLEFHGQTSCRTVYSSVVMNSCLSTVQQTLNPMYSLNLSPMKTPLSAKERSLF